MEDSETTARRLGAVKSQNTAPEKAVESALEELGETFSKQAQDLEGSPDFVLEGRKAVLFVHGCYWHRHAGCKLSARPKRNRDYWTKKFQRNVERDARNVIALEQEGWRVNVIWECETREDALVSRIKDLIDGEQSDVGS